MKLNDIFSVNNVIPEEDINRSREPYGEDKFEFILNYCTILSFTLWLYHSIFKVSEKTLKYRDSKKFDEHDKLYLLLYEVCEDLKELYDSLPGFGMDDIYAESEVERVYDNFREIL